LRNRKRYHLFRSHPVPPKEKKVKDKLESTKLVYKNSSFCYIFTVKCTGIQGWDVAPWV
jgi:hypothetical protein